MRTSPLTLTPSTVASSSSLDSSNGARPSARPALLTRMSRPPSRSTASAAKPSQLAASVTSSSSATSVSSRSTRRAPPATRTPAAASAAAVARPMPDDAPVTIARLPARSRGVTRVTLSVPPVSRSHHRLPRRALRLVLRERQRHRLAAVGRTALASELPVVRLGLDALESPGCCVHVRVDLRQEVPLGRLRLLVTTGHSITTRLPQTPS